MVLNSNIWCPFRISRERGREARRCAHLPEAGLHVNKNILSLSLIFSLYNNNTKESDAKSDQENKTSTTPHLFLSLSLCPQNPSPQKPSPIQIRRSSDQGSDPDPIQIR